MWLEIALYWNFSHLDPCLGTMDQVPASAASKSVLWFGHSKTTATAGR